MIWWRSWHTQTLWRKGNQSVTKYSASYLGSPIVLSGTAVHMMSAYMVARFTSLTSVLYFPPPFLLAGYYADVNVFVGDRVLLFQRQAKISSKWGYPFCDLCMINSRIPFKIAVKLNRQLFSCTRMTNRKCSAILKDKNQKTIYLVLTWAVDPSHPPSYISPSPLPYHMPWVIQMQVNWKSCTSFHAFVFFFLDFFTMTEQKLPDNHLFQVQFSFGFAQCPFLNELSSFLSCRWRAREKTCQLYRECQDASLWRSK